MQRGEWEYDLFLRADLHTCGYTQWFYFAVSDTHTPQQVQLHRRQQQQQQQAAASGRRGGSSTTKPGVRTPSNTNPRLVNK